MTALDTVYLQCRRHVGENIRELRVSNDLRLIDLLELLQSIGMPMSVQVLSRIERGERHVDASELVALAIALDVTPNDLLGWDADDPS